jgi:phage terminase Nu1 subunit (DNA packaging protein)
MTDDIPEAPMPAPEFDTTQQFAGRIQTSDRTVKRLVDQGMPVVRIGDLTRIDPPVALDWLRNRNKPKPVCRGRPRKSVR